MKKIKTVGVVGFGVMGAAIGLNAAAAGYRVVYKELNDELVATMYEKLVLGSLRKRVEKGKLSQAEMDKVAGMITGTSDYAQLAPCDLIIEAAVESMDLKIQIFSDLAKVVSDETIIASNTSTFLIEKLMAKVPNPSRTAGLHYFFPANVNRLVEVIRQKATSDETYAALMAFAEKNRKVAITVKDFPGFAINPIFISAYMVLDSFYGDTYNVATLEDISQKTLGVRYGIMWVQNGSGLGTAFHAGTSMVDYLQESTIGFPPMPDQLKRQFESGQMWNLTDGDILEDEKARTKVSDCLLGTIFAIASHLIDQEVVSVKDLELGVCTALAWPKGPFGLMNEKGLDESARLIQTAVDAGLCKTPPQFSAGAPAPWEL
jgi:3-hydroxyacyl-CoA dehydrogenase